MDRLYKEAGKNCRFTYFNKDNSETVNLVWTFPKDWRYTQAVNHRYIIAPNYYVQYKLI